MIDTDGHTTVVVTDSLPSVDPQRQKLLETFIENAPGSVWSTESPALNMKVVLVGGLVALGIVLLMRRK